MPNAPLQATANLNKREQKRAGILDGAEEIFGRDGFKKTTMNEIAFAAGVSRPLLYTYFSDKEAILEAVLERLFQQWHSVMEAEATRNTPGTAHTLRLVFLSSLQFIHQRQVLKRLLAWETRATVSAYSDVIKAGNSMLQSLVHNILEQGIERGEVRNDLDIDDISHVVSEVFLSHADRMILNDAPQLNERRVNAILETLLHGIITKPGN